MMGGLQRRHALPQAAVLLLHGNQVQGEFLHLLQQLGLHLA